MTPNEPDTIPEGGRPRGGRRRSDARRVRGPARWVAIGISIGFLIGFAAVLTLTQTSWGRDQILGFTLRTLGGRLNGDLVVERLEGNVITGARLYSISLRDTTGAPLALADSAFIQYRLASFLGGDVVINDLLVFDARVDLYRMPGDTIWNYQGVLQDPTPDPNPEAASATLIEEMHLYDTRVTMRTPVEGDPRLSAEARARQVEEVIADTVRNVVEEVPGGYLKLTSIDVDEAGLAQLFIGPDERGGTYLEVTDADADVRLWRDPPLEVRDARARIHLREGMLSYEAAEVELPNTTAQSVGQIDMRGERPLYNLYLSSPDFTLADMRWFYPWLPEDPEGGTGSVRLWIDDRDDGLAVIAHDLELSMPDTRIEGQFGVITGPDVLRFVDVDLRSDPLNIESVEALLPRDIPVEGLVIGTAEVEGTGNRD